MLNKPSNKTRTNKRIYKLTMLMILQTRVSLCHSCNTFIRHMVWVRRQFNSSWAILKKGHVCRSCP